jgi:hypothetical protein
VNEIAASVKNIQIEKVIVGVAFEVHISVGHDGELHFGFPLWNQDVSVIALADQAR